MDDQQAFGSAEITQPSGEAIVAVATAPGSGAVGIVRVSGGQMEILAQALLGKVPEPRHAHLVALQDVEGLPLDECLLLWFPSPHSYTGEDVIELQGHGGPAVLQRVIQKTLQLARKNNLPLRLARAGEFTERAFLNGKMDLLKAQAVADLVSAQTQEAAQSAARSLAGEFSTVIYRLSHATVNLRVLVEACLDFPEEEGVDVFYIQDMKTSLQDLLSDLRQVIAHSQKGILLTEGVYIALIGRPNVGKSALLNALAQAEVAIVSPYAGTTRDTVERSILLYGLTVHVVDTAGIRDTHDAVEQMGIARSWKAVEEAQVVIFIHDAGEHENAESQQADAALRQQIQHPHCLEVWNKADLLEEEQVVSWKTSGRLLISAKTGQGVDDLREYMAKAVGWSAAGGDGVFMARTRQCEALRDAQGQLLQAGDMLESGAPPDWGVLAEHFRQAQRYLATMTGEVSNEDLLGKIFGTFCIGK